MNRIIEFAFFTVANVLYHHCKISHQVFERAVEVEGRRQTPGVATEVGGGGSVTVAEPRRQQHEQEGQPLLQAALNRLSDRSPADAVVTRQQQHRAVQCAATLQASQQRRVQGVAGTRQVEVVVGQAASPEQREGEVSRRRGAREASHVIQKHLGRGASAQTELCVHSLRVSHVILGLSEKRPRVVVRGPTHEAHLEVVEDTHPGSILGEG